MKRIFNCIVAVVAIACFAFMFNACSEDTEVFTLEEDAIELREKKDKCKTKVVTGGDVIIENADAKDPVALGEQIKKALEEAAKKAKGPEKDALTFAATQAHAIAASIFLEFGDLDALTFPYLYTIPTKGGMTIVVFNVQLYKPNPNPNPEADKKLKEHEDGHSYIANEVTKKVADKAAEENDCKPKETREKIRSLINSAQAAYDTATNHGQKEGVNQAKEAKKAAQKVIKDYLKSR